MTDVLLTATNPEDSSVVPVACNEKGELKLEEPQVSSDLYVEKAGDTMTGNLHLGDNITLDASTGSATFIGNVVSGNNAPNSETGERDYVVLTPYGLAAFYRDGETDSVDHNFGVVKVNVNGTTGGSYAGGGAGNFYSLIHLEQDGTSRWSIKTNGAATFSSDVVIGSRGDKWMIVESNGLAHLVKQTQTADIETADLVNPSGETSYPPLRDIPGELTMVEEQLQKVLEKLRMVPEAGWEVWDGSD